jgi:hypothetical protein
MVTSTINHLDAMDARPVCQREIENPILHQWFYYPDMRSDEALVFKAHDSESGRLQGCPHTGFDDPDCPDGVPPHSNVEILAFTFLLFFRSLWDI